MLPDMSGTGSIDPPAEIDRGTNLHSTLVPKSRSAFPSRKRKQKAAEEEEQRRRWRWRKEEELEAERSRKEKDKKHVTKLKERKEDRTRRKGLFLGRKEDERNEKVTFEDIR